MDCFTLVSDFDFKIKAPSVQNVAEYILESIDNFVNEGRKECIDNTISGEAYDYKDIRVLSQRVARTFKNRGMTKGDTVIYSSHDGAKLHIFLLGVWQANGNVRSSYPDDTGDVLIERILESKVKWIFCGEENLSENIKVISEIPWPVEIIFSGSQQTKKNCCSIEGFFKDDGHDYEDIQIETSLTDTALILPTSGTTGKSKGAVYTHENLLKNIIILQKLPFIDKPEAPFLLTSRLTHFTGTVFPLAFFSSGRRIIINPNPSKENILDAICTYKTRGILAFPKYLSYLANDSYIQNYDISSLKYAFTAGQVIGPSFVEAINSIPTLKSFMVIYGMTEAGLLTVNANWDSPRIGIYKGLDEFPPFSCGKLAPGNQLQIRDIETGKMLSTGQLGELYFNSPFTCNGYLNNSKANDETFIDGWVRTGDIGYYDEKGFVYITDRLKETFKYFNNHICPSELENILLKYPGISEACVVGIADPDGGDTIPRAFVVARIQINPSDIKRFLNDQVASYKKLRGGLFVLKEMPLGKTGKLNRKCLETWQMQSQTF